MVPTATEKGKYPNSLTSGLSRGPNRQMAMAT